MEPPDAPDGRTAPDGSSPERAVGVGSVAEEYAWVGAHCPGFRVVRQALQFLDGRPYDVLELRDAAGEERSVYFDVSAFFGT